MPTYKVTYVFADNVNGVGWSEGWWAQGADAVSAGATQGNYPTVRLPLLMDTARITAIRVSNVDKPRDSVYLVLGSNPVGTIPSATRKAAGVWDCLLVKRDVTAGTLQGHMFLRMVPGDIFTGRLYTGQNLPPANWQTMFTAWVTELTGGAYFLRKKAGGITTYVACQAVTPERRTERKLGRPFDALRGRARNKALAATRAVSPVR